MAMGRFRSAFEEAGLRRFPEYRLRESMSKSVNKVILLGNVGKDPEVRTSASGNLVAEFSLATNDRVKDQGGNWKDRTEWHTLIAFQRTAEIIRDFVSKGAKLYVEGRIQTHSWDDKNTGEKRYRTQIVVNDVSLIGGQKPQHSEYSQEPARDDFSQASPSSEITDDDIPF
jgi:single-strand DNA-binding protein